MTYIRDVSMTGEYTTESHLANVASILDEYTAWHMQVLRCLFYPDEMGQRGYPSMPVSYRYWATEARESGLNQDMIKRLSTLHADLATESEMLLEASKTKSKTPYFEPFNNFILLYEEFISLIRTLEKDILLKDSGIDHITGVLNTAALTRDFTEEMDRFARQGKPFSMALVRIDGLEDIKAQHDQSYVNKQLRLVADILRRSIRSFDDAYRMEDDLFLLLLKQTDITGSVRAMERLKAELEEQQATYELDGKQIYLSLSSCIAEPVQGDHLDQLLSDLRYDLSKTSNTAGAVLEYFEISPLQRYINKAET